MIKSTLLLLTFILSSHVVAGNICGDNKLDKITICHAGSNNNPNFVNICVDLSAVHGHLKNHSHDSVGPCGSSGESLSDGIVYACNAGIKHEKPASRLCYSRTNPSLSCKPESCESGQSCDCVCSGEDGSSIVDFMTFSGRSFSSNSDLESITNESFWSGTTQSRTSIESQSYGFVDSEGFVVATNSPENYVLRTNSLSFQLSSELYGSEYFVDLCWKNVNDSYAGEFEISPKYSFKNKQLFGETYTESANILTRTDVECVDDNEQSFNLFEESLSYFPSQMSELLPQIGTVDRVSFCRVRHYFKEDSENFRPWELNAIEVTTSLDVSLTSDQNAPNDTGVKLCHPISITEYSGSSRKGSGNGNGNGNGNDADSSKVCQIQFETNKAFEQFVLDYEDSSQGNSNSTYSVTHNHDSRFTDSLSCEDTTGLVTADPVDCLIKLSTDGYHGDTNFQISINGTLIIKEKL